MCRVSAVIVLFLAFLLSLCVISIVYLCLQWWRSVDVIHLPSVFIRGLKKQKCVLLPSIDALRFHSKNELFCLISPVLNDPSSVFRKEWRQWIWGGGGVLYECDITRERWLMVNKYIKKRFLDVPLEAPWLCTIWAAQPTFLVSAFSPPCLPTSDNTWRLNSSNTTRAPQIGWIGKTQVESSWLQEIKNHLTLSVFGFEDPPFRSVVKI